MAHALFCAFVQALAHSAQCSMCLAFSHSVAQALQISAQIRHISSALLLLQAHELGGAVADGGALHVELDTFCHHLYVLFLETEEAQWLQMEAQRRQASMHMIEVHGSP